MSTPTAASAPALVGRQTMLTLMILIVLLITLGLWRAQTTEVLWGYLAVTAASFLPAVLWIWARSPGIPILASAAMLHYIFYAVPMLNDRVVQFSFTPLEIFRSAMTVALFLVVSTFVWSFFIFLGTTKRVVVKDRTKVLEINIKRMIYIGIAVGILYHILLFNGLFSSAGSLFGLVRAVLLSCTVLSCFMLGHARAKGLLRGQSGVLASAGFVLLIVFAISNLFLISGIIYFAAALLGYVITSKRVPWLVVGLAAVVITVLQAGKDDVRDMYWPSRMGYTGAQITVTQIPTVMEEWTEAGLTALTKGNYLSPVKRASLLQILLRAQHLTPHDVPFLEGKTYAMVPNMLVPRFINPEKITSQAIMKFLNVHYRILAPDQAKRTAVGWGLIAEGYANFGYLGVIAIALVWGLVCGFFERRSRGASVLSLETLLAIGVLVRVIDLEADSGSLATTLMQTVVAVWLFYRLFKYLIKRDTGAPQHSRSSRIIQQHH